MVLAGAGNLGHALCSYKDFGRHGFQIVAVLDNDAEKVGGQWDGVPIEHIDQAGQVVARTGAELAIIATPGNAAQGVVDRLREVGIRGILNFAPRKLETGGDVRLRNVDITIELEGLTYALRSTRR